MFARSFSFVIPMAACFASLAEINAQSTVFSGWPAVKTASPEMITVVDTRPQPDRPVPTIRISRTDRKRIEPDEDDKARFRDLLEKEDSGIVKLLNVSCPTDG